MGTEQFGKGNVWASIKDNGVWKNVPYVPSNFRAVAPMTLAISGGAASFNTNRYCMIGLGAASWSLMMQFQLSGTSGNTIELLPPVKLAKQTYGTGVIFDGVARVVRLQAIPAFSGNPDILKVFTIPSGNFSLNNNCTLEFTITFDVGNSLL